MQIKFPANCATEASKMSFCHRLDELLRQQHNTQGEKFRNGLLTQAEWDSYQKDFLTKSRTIHSEINNARQTASNGGFWNSADVDKDVI